MSVHILFENQKRRLIARADGDDGWHLVVQEVRHHGSSLGSGHPAKRMTLKSAGAYGPGIIDEYLLCQIPEVGTLEMLGAALEFARRETLGSFNESD